MTDNLTSKKRVLITGANGQLGWELQRTAPATIEPIACDRQMLDICDFLSVSRFVEKHRPDLIINCAAYTAVDRAEQEPDIAHAINVEGASNLAHIAKQLEIKLIHISTDFVFDGHQSTPYRPEDSSNPQSVYGKTKLEGDRAVLDGTDGEALIIRTSWVYSSHGNNFVKTMLKLMQERDELNIISDQVGTPSWARNIASTIWKMVSEYNPKGLYHWSDAGVASWYDFAIAIQDEALRLGLLSRQIPIEPINSIEYPLPAKRPAYSVLDKSKTWQLLGEKSPHWRHSLTQMLHELKST
jgi:dTDP-4-dehydrorhamnose reductase